MSDVAEVLTDQPPSESTRHVPQTPRRRLADLPEWAVALTVAAVGALIFTIPYLNRWWFYYIGDNPESFVPLWHHFGGELRAGRWLTMDPDGWMGGNYAAEAAYSLWNPVSLGNYVVVSLFDDLSLAAAVVMIEFLTLLCLGTFLLARQYGAGRAPAAVIAVALPASGFTLYYEASGWPAGLMAFTWVTWFWWGAKRHVDGQASPMLPFVLGVLAMTTGNPYAALGLVIVLLGLAVELVVRREWGRLLHLVVMGSAVGVSALLVFLPLLATSGVSDRGQLARIQNDTFMVPDLGDLAASSAVTYLPSITNWNSQLLESLPSTYFLWLALPLLPWLRFRGLRAQATRLVSLAVVGGVYLVLVLGPSNLWLFRWPIRLVEYLYLVVAIVLAVGMSAGPARERVPLRIAATGGIVLLSGYLAWAVRPEYYRLHVAGVVLLAILVAAVVWGWRRAPRLLAVLGIAGTAAVVAFQTALLPVLPPGGDVTVQPSDVTALEELAEGYEGTVLQLASQPRQDADELESGEILFGNLPVAAGTTSVNRYSGIGFAEMSEALCLDYRGSVCPEAFAALWESTSSGQPPPVDTLRVSTVVLQEELLPKEAAGEPPEGWRVEERNETRTVWVREDPLTLPGRVSAVTDGVQVLGAQASAHREVVDVAVPEDGGRLTFARLAWPGYTASLDGEVVDVGTDDSGLLTVDLPEGDHSLFLAYSTPTLLTGALALAAAGIVVLVQTVVWVVGRRRNGPPGDH